MTKRTKEILGFDDRWLLLLGIPTVSALMSLLMFGQQIEEECMDIFFRCIVLSLFYVSIYWFFFRWIIIQARRIFPQNQDVVKRLILQSIVIIIGYFVMKAVITNTLDGFLHTTLGVARARPLLMLISSLVLTFLVIAVYEGTYFFTQLQRSILEREQLERANLHSQLEGLKNQVNPHFLFNSLNTLSTIIFEDSEKAVRFVQQMAKVYRYILEIREKKLIPLSEELDFLHAYIYLLKERFEDNLHVEINIPDASLKDKIVPLSLQMLIENAIKHNIISTQRPLRIELFIEKNSRLVVRNNLQKKKQMMQSTGLGLQNIKNRYAFFSERLVEVIVSANAFIVSLPLLKLKEIDKLGLLSE
ncbi:MAG: histidine kinase [Bacteroidota bacterium]